MAILFYLAANDIEKPRSRKEAVLGKKDTPAERKRVILMRNSGKITKSGPQKSR
jgi:hypothetical protein